MVGREQGQEVLRRAQVELGAWVQQGRLGQVQGQQEQQALGREV